MKAAYRELESLFLVELQAETVEECSLLVRLGLNHIKAKLNIFAHLPLDGAPRVHIQIGKRKDFSSIVKGL